MTSDVLKQLVPTGVFRFFDFIEAAEDVLQSRYHDVAKSDQPFGVLSPPKDIRNAAMWVYEAHVKELCDRWEESGVAEVPTTAELLMLVSKVTLNHPCTPSLASYMEALFRAVKDGRPIDQADLDDDQREYHLELQRKNHNVSRKFHVAYEERTFVGRQ